MRTTLHVAIIVSAIGSSVVAQDDVIEVPLPFVTLVQPPRVPKLKLRPPERDDEIKQHISDLSGLKSKDIGILDSPIGTTFVPVGRFDYFGRRTDEKLETFAPMSRLV